MPIAVRGELKAKISEMEQQSVLAKVTERTPWISSMVIVRKPGELRICLDPMDLHKGIKRNHHPIPTIEEIAPRLNKARIFSVVDAKDGFLQVMLDEPSSYLTTFWIPFGRYRWLHMPFGLSSSPEEFQRRLEECLEGLKQVEVIADDIVIYGQGDTEEEAQRSHISQMPRPTDAVGVHRLLGIINYLSKFLPRLSTVCEPLRRLTDKEAMFDWLPHHEEAYTRIKQLLTEAPILKFYDPTKAVVVECDSSEVGLGAALTQEGRPVA